MSTTPSATPSRRIPPLGWALIAALSLIWGTSFLSNRAALAGAGFLTVVTFRVMGGAVVLWAVVLARRLPLPQDRSFLWRFLVMGALNNAIPFALIVWGQQHIDSGLAAILNASTAIFGVLIAALVFADERLTPTRLAGVLLGFAGVVIAIGPAALGGLTLTSAGQWAVIGASVSYGFAGAFARANIRGLSPVVAAAGMLSGATLWLLPAMLLIEGVPSFAYAAPVWAGLLWLALACSALAYLIYYRILALVGAGNLSLVTLTIAPVAIVAGWAVYGERLGLNAFAGFGVLAAGLWLLNRAPKPQAPKPRDEAPRPR